MSSDPAQSQPAATALVNQESRAFACCPAPGGFMYEPIQLELPGAAAHLQHADRAALSLRKPRITMLTAREARGQLRGERLERRNRWGG